jgi:hypothetical protein
MNYLQFLLQRLREPSTYAAIAAGLTAVQAVPDTGTKVAIGVASLVGVLAPENKPAA